MWEMAKSSIILFFAGKLFAEPAKVYRQAAIGVALTAVLCFGLGFAGVPLLAAAVISGFVGGAVQPYLFKDLKYR